MSIEDGDADELGYGRPPKWAQFPKGHSGNPKGRPKKPRPTIPDQSASDEILRKELARKVRVKDGAGTRDIPGIELVQRAQVQAAAKGNAFAQREVLKNARELERRDIERMAAEAADERETFERAVRFKAMQTTKWAEAAAKGQEPDEPWPHPDDILIDQGRHKWRIRGPWIASDFPYYEYCRAERDVAFLRATISCKERTIAECGKHSIWDFVWMLWDQQLPLRWQFLPRLSLMELSFLNTPLRKLRHAEREAAENAAALRPLAGIGPRDSTTYRKVNAMMKPMLEALGYRSLAQFERAVA